jgi:hypothetical protein
MTWFTASIVIGMKRKDEKGGPIIVLENAVLIEAATSEEARLKAEEIGKTEASLDDGLTINGAPALRIFAGVRKIINVSNPEPYDLDQDPPTSGTEVTYSEFEVPDEDTLYRLASGDAVDLRYVD